MRESGRCEGVGDGRGSPCLSQARIESSYDVLVTAPIVVDIAPPLAQESEFAQALVASCSRAIGPGGCVLRREETHLDEARALVTISFSESYAHVRVVAAAPSRSDTDSTREISFRGGDPLLERFRAAGLVAAGLVSDADAAARAEPEVDQAPPPARDTVRAPSPTLPLPPPAAPPTWWAGGLLGIDRLRPRAGFSLGADIPVRRSIAYVAVSGSYEQTLRSDGSGISESREEAGLGLGLRIPLVDNAVILRGWAQLQLGNIQASIHQPRQDAGARVVVGPGAGADVLWPVSAQVALFAGSRVVWWGSDTLVRVQGTKVTTISAFAVALTLGLEVRLP
jgi:hypothetical protein